MRSWCFNSGQDAAWDKGRIAAGIITARRRKSGSPSRFSSPIWRRPIDMDHAASRGLIACISIGFSATPGLDCPLRSPLCWLLLRCLLCYQSALLARIWRPSGKLQRRVIALILGQTLRAGLATPFGLKIMALCHCCCLDFCHCRGPISASCDTAWRLRPMVAAISSLSDGAAEKKSLG